MGWERRKTWDREKTKGFPGDAQRRGMEAGRRAENQHSRSSEQCSVADVEIAGAGVRCKGHVLSDRKGPLIPC